MDNQTKTIIFLFFCLFIYSLPSQPISGPIDESNPRYRPFSGYGNNIHNPTWGAAGTPMIRSIPNAYLDGIGEVPGMDRPSPRLISNVLSEVSYKGNLLSDAQINEFHTYFGQFLVSDMLDAAQQSTESLIYSIPIGDPFYDPFSTGNVTSTFYRQPYIHGTNATGPRAFINPDSHFLDCSFIYGNDNSTLLQWLDPNTGKLLIKEIFDSSYNSFVIPPSHYVLTGDFRFNKTPPLYAIGTLLYREHNRLVDVFAAANPTWGPEQLFQESRRMVIAFVQNIAIREYLAATLGQALPAYQGYNSSVDPSVDIFFGTVAMRYGHTAVTRFFERLDDNLNDIPEGNLFVHESLANPDNWLIYDSNSSTMVPSNECLFRGLSAALTGNVDVGLVDDIRGLLFHPPYTIGKDLFVINIMRGRDHGLPDYNTCRTYFGLPKVNSFAEISSDPRVQEALESLYSTVDNIDPYVGAIAEDHTTGIAIGPLIHASILDQFSRLRDGDRYWFENPEYFNSTEISLIYGTKLNDLITRNFLDVSIDSLPVSAFFAENRQLNSSIQDVDAFLFPSLINSPIYLTKMLLAPFYQLSWSIDYDQQTITYYIQVKGSGWVGIGFNPELNSMKSADIVMCRLDPGTNVPDCMDFYALDVGLPTPDIYLGGTDDVIQESVSVTLINGFVTAIFARKLDTGDPFDKPTTDNQPIIFAFNEITFEPVYHGPTRSSSHTISFFSDFSGPPRQEFVPGGILVFIGIIASLGLVISIVFIFLILFFTDHFRLLTPPFCIIILVGTIMGYVFALLLIPEPTDGICIAQIWLLGISFVLIFVSLFAKIYRIWKLISDANKLVLRTIEVTALVPPLIICVVLESAFLIAFTIVAPPVVNSNQMPNNVYVNQCSGDLIFWGVFVGYKAAFLLVGVFLAFLTRNMDKLSESKAVGFSLYVFALDLVVMIPIGFIIGTSPLSVSVIKAIAVVIPYVSTTLLLFGEAVINLFKGGEPFRVQTGVTKNRNTIPSTEPKTNINSGSSTLVK